MSLTVLFAVGVPSARAAGDSWSVADNARIETVATNWKQGGAQFVYSSDNRYVAFVLESPSLARDSVDYTLTVHSVRALRTFAAGGALPRPELEINVDGSGSAPGISDLAWSSSGDELFFLDRDGGRSALKKWSPDARSIEVVVPDGAIDYDVLSADHLAIFLEDTPPVEHGQAALVLTGRPLSKLFGGEEWEARQFAPTRFAIASLTDGSIRATDVFAIPAYGAHASADGRHIALAEPFDAEWTGRCWRRSVARVSPTGLAVQVAVLDLETGQVVRPFDGPLAGNLLLADSDGPFVAWSPTGHEAIVPLTLTKDDECATSDANRLAQPAAYSYSPVDHRVRKVRAFPINAVGELDYVPQSVQWDSREKRVWLTIAPPEAPYFRHGIPRPLASPIASVDRVGERWIPSRAPAPRSVPQPIAPVLEVRQSDDVPPRILARTRSGKLRELRALASFATDRALGTSELTSWQDSSGQRWTGLLTLPAHEVPVTRLPLILQTHGQRDGAFFSQGPGQTAYPGRAALSRGFAVLTVYDLDNRRAYLSERRTEPSRMIEGYQAAISLFVARGLVDAHKVGVIGWSRTSYYVKFALTHFPKLFAAAVVADGLDYGYGQLLAMVDVPLSSSFPQQYIETYGGLPWQNWQVWLPEAPGFGVENVTAPVRIEATSGLAQVLFEWEFYAALRRLGRAVDLIAYPDGTHSLVRPSQRVASMEGALDWLDYWLNGRVDPAAEKRTQYERWNLMRDQRALATEAASHALPSQP